MEFVREFASDFKNRCFPAIVRGELRSRFDRRMHYRIYGNQTLSNIVSSTNGDVRDAIKSIEETFLKSAHRAVDLRERDQAAAGLLFCLRRAFVERTRPELFCGG